MDEDALIVSLRGLRHDDARQRSLQFAGTYAPIERKAWWAYNRAGHPAGLAGPLDRETFRTQWIESWAEFFLSAAYLGPPEVPYAIRERGDDAVLFLGWHSPEYPCWLPAMVAARTVILIARRADWMASDVIDRSFLEFRSKNAGLAILRAFRNRRLVYAMMDHCYPETSSSEVHFLGWRARMPAGVLRLASRYGYRTVVLTTRDSVLAIADEFCPTDVSEAAQRVARSVEREICRHPARWLMWPSLDRQWIDVEYD